MRAKACTRCKEYIIIHASNPVNQNNVKKFEKFHLGHSIIIINYFEIKDQYKRFDPNKEIDVVKKTVIV
ncbi:MAG: hypothetical protein ACFFBP_13205 [Promethearchaeota archaeon]